MQGRVQPAGPGDRVGLGPQEVDDLFPVQAMAGAQGQQLDQGGGTAAAPCGVTDGLPADRRPEAAQQPDLQVVGHAPIVRRNLTGRGRQTDTAGKRRVKAAPCYFLQAAPAQNALFPRAAGQDITGWQCPFHSSPDSSVFAYPVQPDLRNPGSQYDQWQVVAYAWKDG